MRKFLAVLSVFLLIGCFSACSSASGEIAQTIGIDLSDGVILSHQDTHGGFHGDGARFVEIGFDGTAGTAAADQIAQHEDWRPLPLSRYLQAAVYGAKIGDTSYGPLVSPADLDHAAIPAIQNGYYYFYNRHSQSGDARDDTDLLQRHSVNVTIALYDIDSNHLYFYELDT